ncbi:hypothetical protein MUN89_08470 [Halobacillus salinarum]|uniref:DUF3976 domain-containing protein n=1 Tax=Halobacillus salinarum TaxID=2932257 RepID=A0ABY4ENA4_9BACI|nr:hypothetical protein [Halobacillus salinarum]UOQ45940.1 hypothetical protein MUN89_08470 [Halobacillus salinarum]
MQWVFPVLFIVGFFISYLVIRRETKNNSLTKKGFIKLIITMILLFLVAFGLGFFNG